MHQPPPPPSRPRDPSEYFGIERQLWDDRHDGRLRKEWSARLRRAEMQLALAPQSGVDGERARLMRDALRAAQDTLQAAGQVMAGRGLPPAWPSAWPGVDARA